MLDGIVLGLVAGLITRGSLANLASTHLKGETAIVLLLVIQLSIPSVASRVGLSRTVALALWLVVMAGLVGLAIWNRDAPGMLLAGIGIAMNFLVIGLNAGMPVSLSAIARLADEAAAPAFDLLHQALTDETIAPLLADVIPVPGPAWHRGVASVGDLLLMTGTGYFVYASLRGKKASAS
ncbi:MAG: DUF5317 family protein [Coriobacteriales bacterium]|nr:DUF5317 domain-containing protein [Actinomycetes bacterium]